MEINFVVEGTELVFKDLDGNDIVENVKGFPSPLTYSKALSSMLVEGKSMDDLKLYEMALALKKDKKLTVDSTDFELVKKAISNTQQFTTLITGQLKLFLTKVI